MKSFAPTTGLIFTIAGPAIVTWLLISGSVLRVSAGAKINSRRCENIGASAIFDVTGQDYLNNAAVCASVLCEIRDLHEMIAGHCDFDK